MGIDNNKKKEEEAEEEKKEVAAATGGHPPNSMAATSPNPPTAHISPKTSPGFPLQRPEIIQAAVIHFKNKEEKWIAFIGLIDQKPYEIFTGIADDTQGILLPKWVKQGVIIKVHQTDGPSRYDFQYENQQGYKITIQGLSHKFNPEYWNYAKLISGILRHGMLIEKVVKLVNGLQLKDDNINTWKNGIARALRRFIPNHTQIMGGQCQQCGGHHLQYREGCLICQDCGHSKCE